MQPTPGRGQISIVGAGIGGLTAALALAQKNWSVTLLEKTTQFTEVGAGLQLSSNASCVLHALGLGKALSRFGFLPQAIEIRDGKSGRQLATESLGDQALHAWGSPYYHIHRADLQQILLEAVRDKANIELRSNAACIALQQDQNTVTATVANHDSVCSDLLVGADGIHSMVREALWGEAQARFTGHVAWRLMIPSQALPEQLIAPVATLWMGPGAHFVHYYVRNGDYINCVCVVEQTDWLAESWTEPGDKDALKNAFKGWHKNLQLLIDAADADSCYRWGLFDRDPLSQWHRGNITLLGDACHPTLPFLAQGAAMAIEDAAVLAYCLDQEQETEAALAEYEALRKARTAKVQLTSRRNGRIYHLSGAAAAARNLAIRSGLASPRKATEWLYSYDATRH